MSRSSGLRLVERVAMGLAMLVVGMAGTGCGVERSRHDAAMEEVREARVTAAQREGQLAVLQCREAALAQRAELLDARQRDLAVAQQSARKLEDLATRNADLAERLQKTEATLAELEKARPMDVEAPAHDKPQPGDMYVRRPTGEARETASREMIRSVQAMVDSGRVKATVRNGRVQFHLPRRLDEADPYRGGETERRDP